MKVACKPGLENLLECFLSSAFARIINVLHEKSKKILILGRGFGGGGGGGTVAWGRLAPAARTPILFSYGHPSRTTGTIETTIWIPGFIRKMETVRDDYMETRLNAGFLTCGTTGDFID